MHSFGIDFHRRSICNTPVGLGLGPRMSIVVLLPKSSDTPPGYNDASVRFVDRTAQQVPVETAGTMRKYPSHDVRRFYNLVLHQLIKHNTNHLVGPFPEVRNEFKDMLFGFWWPGEST